MEIITGILVPNSSERKNLKYLLSASAPAQSPQPRDLVQNISSRQSEDSSLYTFSTTQQNAFKKHIQY